MPVEHGPRGAHQIVHQGAVAAFSRHRTDVRGVSYRPVADLVEQPFADQTVPSTGG
jgi:hypothetical protein